GTFTITNLGMYGVESFTPIVIPGQSAILGIGKIERVPVVEEDRIAIKPRALLSLTFDHRAADGATAAKFLGRIKELIENGGFKDES
ncbi:MAG: 2-oxo acid dehydrogenase subunit E2, partial [Nitrososphaerota archaeon]